MENYPPVPPHVSPDALADQLAAERGQELPAAPDEAAAPDAAPAGDGSPAADQTGDQAGDEFSSLTGDDLDKAVTDAGIDASTGGSKSDGSLTADEKRDALRQKAAAEQG